MLAKYDFSFLPLKPSLTHTFYHFIPFLYLQYKVHHIDFYIDEEKRLYSKDKNGYFLVWRYRKIPENTDFILISTEKLEGWSYDLFDVNYIYSVEKLRELKGKNFKVLRKNIRKIEKTGKKIEWILAKKPDIISYKTIFRNLDIDMEKKDSFWLKELLYDDKYWGYGIDKISFLFLFLEDELVSLEVFGFLDKDILIHFIQKYDKAIPFISEFSRYYLYISIPRIKYINDGSDLGNEGIKRFKKKFNPEILNIYSLYR